MTTLPNKLYNHVCECAINRSMKENDYNGKQKLACIITSKNRQCVLCNWYELL